MRCPVCVDVDLVITERRGVEIDYCPRCRGVWLDRGELDKIIERSAGLEAGDAPSSDFKRKNDAQRPPRDRHDSSDYDDYDDDDYRKRPKRRRKSFLEDLFDIID